MNSILKSALILMTAAIVVGCASGPGSSESGEQLSAVDAQRCEDITGMTSDLAALRERRVSKRQAIKLQLSERQVSSLDRGERNTVTRDLYETAILVYALPDFSSATLEAFRWSECKTMALQESALDYSDIVAIKVEILRCQSQFEQKNAKKHTACIASVVKDRSRATDFDAEIEKIACQRLIKTSINLHNKAVKLAKSGKNEKALGALEKIMENWKKITSGSLSCSNIDRATAADGILRATQDVSFISPI